MYDICIFKLYTHTHIIIYVFVHLPLGHRIYLLTGQEKLAAVPASLKVWIGGLTEETTWILSFNEVHW